MPLKSLLQAPKQFGQRNTFLRGMIYVPGKQPLLCWVQSLSLSGAQLVLTSSATLPLTFNLLVDGRGLKAKCELIEQSGDRVEVAFH
jgi:hypothetical protein